MLTDRGGAKLIGVCIINGVACVNRIGAHERRYLTEKLGLGKHINQELGCELGLDVSWIRWPERLEGTPDDDINKWNTSGFTPGSTMDIGMQDGPDRWLDIHREYMPDDLVLEALGDDLDDEPIDPDDQYEGLQILPIEEHNRDEDFPRTIFSTPYITTRSRDTRCIEYIWGRFVGKKYKYWRFGRMTSLLPILMLVKRRASWWPLNRCIENWEGKWVWIPGLMDYMNAVWAKCKRPDPGFNKDEGIIMAKMIDGLIKQRIRRDQIVPRKEDVGFM